MTKILVAALTEDFRAFLKNYIPEDASVARRTVLSVDFEHKTGTSCSGEVYQQVENRVFTIIGYLVEDTNPPTGDPQELNA